jgi:prepilin-type N-terminal cleavage/methylation domain-containing protein
MKGLSASRQGEQGFTLIELLVVVLIVGILAAVAVPQYFKVVEKGKFSESMSFLGGVQQSEERYLARYGVYWPMTGSGTIAPPPAAAAYPFDANLGDMRYFSATIASNTTGPNYTVTFVRLANPCPAVYGCYSVTYTGPNAAAPNPSCSDGPSGPCATDLLPQ